ncbi:MAG TPA: DUF4921 family protein [Candidatus Paceibacterota bacterium]
MSELRQDPVSGDWMINAPERAKRPHDFLPKRKKRKSTPKSRCPFEDLKRSGNWPPIVLVTNKNEDDWRAVIIPNKYPALMHKRSCATTSYRGPYKLLSGIGHHDVLVSRDHNKNIAHLNLRDGMAIFRALQKRYKMLIADSCMVYASAFMNWGEGAGASLHHPHFQILTLPITPPDVEHSLRGSQDYFRKNNKCVHCEMIGDEVKSKKRVILKNKYAVAVAPFVSRQPFEVRIYPLRHRPYFERVKDGELESIVDLLQRTLLRVEKKLNDPDINFFIHTAPVQYQNRYKHYHWHIEILPKITVQAGFEKGTGVDINVIDPNKAAELLR